MDTSLRIAGHALGPGSPCFIVAEISGNHLGQLPRAKRLIQTAKDVGATAVKFQAFTMEEILALRGTGRAAPPWERFSTRELYEQVLTPLHWFPLLFQEAHRAGLVAFSSVFGATSLAALERLGCPAYKIAKPEKDRVDLLTMVRATGKPLLISGRNIYCPGGYPCLPQDAYLPYFRNGWLGLSSHCRDPLLGVVAVARGAKYVEAHLTLDDGVPTLDDPVNLTPTLFAELVNGIRRIEPMLCP